MKKSSTHKAHTLYCRGRVCKWEKEKGRGTSRQETESREGVGSRTWEGRDGLEPRNKECARIKNASSETSYSRFLSVVGINRPFWRRCINRKNQALPLSFILCVHTLAPSRYLALPLFTNLECFSSTGNPKLFRPRWLDGCSLVNWSRRSWALSL